MKLETCLGVYHFVRVTYTSVPKWGCGGAGVEPILVNLESAGHCASLEDFECVERLVI